MECGGHYIYYERNIEMQNYMIASRKRTGMTPSEIIEDTVTKNFRGIIRDKMEKSEQKSRSKNMYALSAFMILVVMVIGITMINNYDKMKGIQSSLEQLNGTDSKRKEAVETIGTIIQAETGNKDTKEPDEKGKQTEADGKEGEATKPEQPEGTGQPEGSGQPEKPEQTEQPQKETPKADEGDLYVVQKGDTLASISKEKYGDISHVEAICKKNGLEDGNLIFIGQKLLLP